MLPASTHMLLNLARERERERGGGGGRYQTFQKKRSGSSDLEVVEVERNLEVRWLQPVEHADLPHEEKVSHGIISGVWAVHTGDRES